VAKKRLSGECPGLSNVIRRVSVFVLVQFTVQTLFCVILAIRLHYIVTVSVGEVCDRSLSMEH